MAVRDISSLLLLDGRCTGSEEKRGWEGSAPLLESVKVSVFSVADEERVLGDVGGE